MTVKRKVIGFTGTREGMTDDQRMAVRELLITLDPDEVRHGDCVGADEDFNNVAVELGLPVVIHPPDDPKHRAWCVGEIMTQRPYLDRNRDIVDAAGVMIACPGGPEVTRSGTWSTIRYAKRSDTQIYIVEP